MKFYLESGKLDEVEQAYKDFRVDGVTIPDTIPLESESSFKNVLRDISKWAEGVFTQSGDYFEFPILASVSSMWDNDGDAMKLVLDLRKTSPFFVVSLPCSFEGVRLAYRMRDEAIPVNINRVLTPMQAVWAARCGAVSVSTCMSLRDIYEERLRFCVRKIADSFRNYSFMSEIVVPVAMSVRHVEEAILGGADAVSCELAVYREGLARSFF